MPKAGSKKGFTLVELCITLAVTMILLVDIIAFVSFIRVQIMNEKGASDGIGQATALSEMIRADFYDDDSSENKYIAMGEDDNYWEASSEKSWGGYWLERAGLLGYDSIKEIAFESPLVDSNGKSEISNSGDMVICEITYYTKLKGSSDYIDSTDTVRFVLIRKTTYVNP